MRRIWAWLKHYLVATPEESARLGHVDDEIRGSDMAELPPIKLPVANVGDEVVVTSESTGQVWNIVSTNKAKTRRRFRAMTAPTVPVPPTTPAFGARPASSLISKSGADVLIENVTIRGGSLNSPSGIGITIRDVPGNVVIRDVDLLDLIGGIYLYNCTGTLTIENVRSRNIGDGSIGSGHSNHIQLAECSVSGHISGCDFLGGRTEDMLSTWHSGGKGTGSEFVIEGNHLQGLVADTPTSRAWTAGSGTGIIISDGAGSPKNGYIIVRNNTLLTPGQVGIQHIDGPGIQTYGNVIYGEKRPQNNNPITSWEGNPRGTVHDNRWYWTNADGSHPGPWYHQSPSGLGDPRNAGPMDPSIDPAALKVTL